MFYNMTEWCTTVLWQILYVAGNNKTYLSLHFCPILTKFRIHQQIFISIPISNSAEIRMLGVALVHADRRTKGTRIVQADSVSDSDSENRNRNEEIIPVNRLTQSPPTRRRLPPLYAPALLNKGHSLRRLAPTLRDRSRNLNLPALYAYPKPAVQLNLFLRYY